MPGVFQYCTFHEELRRSRPASLQYRGSREGNRLATPGLECPREFFFFGVGAIRVMFRRQIVSSKTATGHHGSPAPIRRLVTVKAIRLGVTPELPKVAAGYALCRRGYFPVESGSLAKRMHGCDWRDWIYFGENPEIPAKRILSHGANLCNIPRFAGFRVNHSCRCS